MFRGVNFVGIGVSDMDRSLDFYGDLLGFQEVMFDYTGTLPGMEKMTRRRETKARVVMLKNRNMGPLGLGMIKLVQLLPPDRPDPCTVGTSRLWGDVGLAEVCFYASDSARVFQELLEKGVRAVVTPASGSFPPYGAVAGYAYVRDPDNGLVEFVDGYMCRTLGEDTRIEGVNHVGFGVSNLEVSVKFYRELGFTELLLEFQQGRLYSMATLFPGTPPMLRVSQLNNYYGAGLEIIQLLPPHKPTTHKESWGHLGVMEFGIEVTNLDRAYADLRGKGIEFLCLPETLEISTGQLKYAYVVEPDNLHIALVEQRY